MKEFKELHGESDIIRDWVKETGDVKAPEGFTHNLMTRINLDRIPSPAISKSPLGLPFKIGVVAAFALLFVMALLTPSVETSIYPGLLKYLPDTSRILSGIRLPDLSFMSAYSYVVYILLGILLLILIDSIFIRYQSRARIKKI